MYSLASEDIDSSTVITMTINVCGFSTHRTSSTHYMDSQRWLSFL